jgi:hypothetical protein
MKKLIHILLLISFSTYSPAQIIFIEKIRAIPQNEFYATKDSTLVFPVFRMKNKKIENKINQKLQDDFKKEHDIEKQEHNISSMLIKASRDGLTDMDIEVIYQTKKIISFSLQKGGMGAYPSTWQIHYCFNLETGNLITLDSLIDKTHKKDFLKLVKKKQGTNISSNKKKLLNQLHKKEIDQETYQLAMEEMKNDCWSYYNPQEFTIDGTTLTIIIDCDFPHAILTLSPDSDIKLQLKSISQYINKKYQYLL